MQNLSNEVIDDVLPVGNVRVLIWTDVDDEPIVGIDDETRQETYYVPDPVLRQDALEIEADWREINEALFEAGDLQLQTGSSKLLVNAEGREATNPSLTGNGQSFLSFMLSITGSSSSDALVPESTVNQELQDKLNAKLKPLHLDDLRKSGLSDEMIDKMGCVSMLNHEIHEKIYGTQEHSSKWNGATGYEIPYFDARGNTVLNRYRMFWTEQALEDDPKLPKYMSPQNAATQIYVPHGFSGIKADYVIVTEGEKKAAKAVQEGFPCVALAGVDMWADSKARRSEKASQQRLNYASPLHETLLMLTKDKKVVILFDSDANKNPQLQKSRKRLKDAFLYQTPEWCRQMVMPTEGFQDDQKIGLDDLLIAPSGKAQLRKGVEQCLMNDSQILSPLFELPYKKEGKKIYSYWVPNVGKHWRGNKRSIMQECPGDDNTIEYREISSTPIWLTKTINSIDDDDAIYYELSYIRHHEVSPRAITGDGNLLTITNGKDDLMTLLGAKVLPKYKAPLEEFLLHCMQDGVQQGLVKTVPGTKHRGWRKADEYIDHTAYVSASGVIGLDKTYSTDDPEIPVMPIDSRADIELRYALKRKGDFTLWQSTVEEHVLISPLPTMVLGAGLAGMIRYWCDGSENFIMHLYGASSKGKTLALKASASLWGNPKTLISTWKATANGLERLAASRNGMVMFLDEAGMADEKVLQESAYLIGNGGEKIRATKTAEVRPTRGFEVVAISSGEKALMQAEKQTGQEVRVLDIAIDVDGLLWKTIDTSKCAEDVGRVFDNNYGHAMELMVRGVLKEVATDTQALTKLYAQNLQIIRSHFDGKLPVHINRRCKHHALCLTALEVFLKHVLKWPEAEIEDKHDEIVEFITTYLVRLESDQNTVSEDEVYLRHFSNQLATYQGKFLNFSRPASFPTELYGQIDGISVYCIPSKLKELMKPYDNHRFLKIAEKHKVLVTKVGKKKKVITRRMGGTSADCYLFDMDVLETLLFKDE